MRERTEIEGGAGNLTVTASDFADASVDLGAGNADIACTFSDKAEFELGAGDMSITLLDGRAPYTLDINKGLGHVTVGGKTLPRDEKIGDGDVEIRIVHNLGELNVSFGNAEPVSGA